MKFSDLLALVLFFRLLKQLPRLILHGFLVWLTVLTTLAAVANYEIQEAKEQRNYQDETQPAQPYLSRNPKNRRP